MWYRKAQNTGGNQPPVSGINGPNDEYQHVEGTPEEIDDPYVVGRTRAIDATDQILKDPKKDAYNMTMEEKLSELHQEPMNVTTSIDPNPEDPVVFKGNNSATVAKSYENQPANVPQNRPATIYSR
jgi:hypothetical protein